MSNEWFERGVQDAQSDQLNTTYYQHYYYYRLGYDQARRQLRKPAIRGGLQPRTLALLAFVLLMAGALYLWQRPRNLVVSSLPISAPATPLPTAEPTATPSPEPTAAPTPEPPTLRPEGFAQVVNTNGAPLRARAEPSRGAGIKARIPEGSRVKILEGPVDADGYVWWRVEGEAGSGWVAQGEPGGAVWIEPVQ